RVAFPAEIRCTLKRGGEFADTRYTIRYFQSDGKGLLKNDNGTVFKPNDRYPLTKEVFRLYYTSLSTDRQTIDVYVEDSFGKVQQLTFSFNNEREEGKDKLASSRH
ncbi:conjugative transposon protein TraQ, partial [Prevotella dentalis DSM 3688]